VDDAALAGCDTSAQNVSLDDEGRFSFQGSEGSRYRVQIRYSDGLCLAESPVLVPGDRTVKLVARRGAAIAGVVVDTAGKPVGGATVTAGAQDYTRYSKSNADGTFEIHGLLAGVEHSVSARGDNVVGTADATALPGKRDIRLVATLGLEIRATLVDADGRPLVQAAALVSNHDDSDQRWCTTDEQGVLAVRGLPAGEWTVRVQIMETGGAWRLHACGTIRAGDVGVTLHAEAK
jgi:hypothetical protein